MKHLVVLLVAVMGLCLSAGNVRALSAEDAFQANLKKARQGDASAQYRLGVMYYNGQGVEQDYQKALEWYEKSANQGDSDAQLNVGIMYHEGRKAKSCNGRILVRKIRQSGQSRRTIQSGNHVR